MKKIIVSILVLLLIGVIAMSVFNPRSNSSPYASQQNALADLSGWYEESPDRTWTFVSANAGGNMFTVYVSGDVTNIYRVRMRVRAKQGADYLYFIVHSVSSYDSGNDRTTLMLFGGTDYDLTSAAITDVAFSKDRFPAGFDVDPDKWSISMVDANGRTSTTFGGVVLVDASHYIDLPVGHWLTGYQAYVGFVGVTTNMNVNLALSTSSSSISDKQYMRGYQTVATGDVTPISKNIEMPPTLISVTSETRYYLVGIFVSSTGTNWSMEGADYAPTVIRALSGYY